MTGLHCNKCCEAFEPGGISKAVSTCCGHLFCKEAEDAPAQQRWADGCLAFVESLYWRIETCMETGLTVLLTCIVGKPSCNPPAGPTCAESIFPLGKGEGSTFVAQCPICDETLMKRCVVAKQRLSQILNTHAGSHFNITDIWL
eukprot:364795-Chlamydomonas_euryale.AAC.8